MRHVLIALSALCFSGSALAGSVQVESPGTGALTVLRYTPKAGSAGSATLSTRIRTTSSVMGRDMVSELPSVVSTMKSKVEEVSATSWTVSFSYGDTKLEGEASGMGKTIAEAIRTGLTGASGTLVVSPAGEILSAKATFGGTDGEQSFDLGQWVVRFPDRPIGIGARWAVEDDVVGPNGIAVHEKRTYTLAAVTGNEVKLVVELASSGQPGPITVEGMTATVTKLASTGTASLTVRLDQPLPVTASSGVDTQFDIQIVSMNTSTSTRIQATLTSP